MIFRDTLAIIAGKAVSWISKKLKLGAGATWPGEVALAISPSILQSLASRYTKGIIFIVGTNGKTTTSSMITSIFSKNHMTYVHNTSGANLLNGVVSSALCAESTALDYGVFEVDENSLPHVMSHVVPNIIVVLNLFRDQLDRYGEVDVIAQKWIPLFKSLSKESTLILNADDPLVASFGKNVEANVVYFGLSDTYSQSQIIDHATDSLFCRYCGGRLAYTSYFFSHLGNWYCTICDEKRPRLALSEWASPLPGLYNTYNTMAAVLVGRELHLSDEKIAEGISAFQPAFGRQEEFKIQQPAGKQKKVKLLLSKNPAGFTASLKTVLDLKPKAILLVLNDRIPDGLDVSWIWDIDFELIPRNVKIVVSGDRVYDLALRLQYAEHNQLLIESNLSKAVDLGLVQIKNGETLFALATYSGMLEIREILTGRKIL